jgi:DNA polymerase I-like protein with 3'-5' exonuclease and polymerase domains
VEWPDLSRYDRFGYDTETTGLGYADKPVGIGISTPDRKKWYLRWGHEDGGNNCSLADVVRWSRRELKDPKKTVGMLNVVYDLRMSRSVGIEVKGQYEDAGVMAALINEYSKRGYNLEALSEKYLGRTKLDDKLNQACADRFGGKPTRKAQAKNYWRISGDIMEEYAAEDPDLSLCLVDHLRPIIKEKNLDDVYQMERAIFMVLVRMYEVGVKVDIPHAKRLQQKMRTELAQLEAKWKAEYGDINYGSTQQLVPLFDQFGLKYGRTPERERFDKKTGKMVKAGGNPSIDKDVLESIDHPIGHHIRRMKQLDHYDGTFIQGYMFDNLDPNGVIHPNFHAVKSDWGGTVTGRFSSAGGLNAQNIPARDEEWAPLIRSMFVPMTPDHQWCRADYSQIEYRFFAHYAGGQLRDAYINDPTIDFHDMVAEMTGLKRKEAKNINFGILYGMGDRKTARKLGVSLDDARALLNSYDRRVPEARKLYYQAMNKAAKRGWIRTWGGRVCRFELVPGKQRTFMGTHKALNKLLQGSAADLTKKAMAAVVDAGIVDWDATLMHLTVHDELDFSVPKGREGVKVAKRLREVMEAFELDVPIRCTVEVGKSWGATEEVER